MSPVEVDILSEPIVLTLDTEEGALGLTQDQLSSLLSHTKRIKPLPGGLRVLLQLTSAEEVTADREQLKSAIHDLLRTERERAALREESVRRASDLLESELIREPFSSSRATKPGARKDREGHSRPARKGVRWVLALLEQEAWALTINSAEARHVAELAEREGCQQTAALLRLLAYRTVGRPSAQLEDLIDPKPALANALLDLQRAEVSRLQDGLWMRQLQTLGGMEKGVHFPDIYADVLSALQADPSLSPQKYFEGVDDDAKGIYKSLDAQEREILKIGTDDKHSLTLGGLKRYFTRARRELELHPSSPRESARLRSK